MKTKLLEGLEVIAIKANEPLDIDAIYTFLATNKYVQSLLRSINTIL